MDTPQVFLNPAYDIIIAKMGKRKPSPDIGTVRDFISVRFGISYCDDAVRKILKNRGWQFLRPKPSASFSGYIFRVTGGFNFCASGRCGFAGSARRAAAQPLRASLSSGFRTNALPGMHAGVRNCRQHGRLNCHLGRY
jgi:hypothetical protein